MAEPATSFQQLLAEQTHLREARAEKISCLVWLGVILITYALFLVFVPSVSPDLASNITLLVTLTAPAFALLAAIIHAGYYWPWMMYLNTFLQLTLVSGAILFDARAQGPAYALASMPPLGYALVVIITAFRLQPWLGVFAGIIASAEFLLLYLFVLHPSAEETARIPSLGFEVTLMKVVLYLGMGIVAGIAASRLRGMLATTTHDALRSADLEKSFGRFISREVAEEVFAEGGGRIAARETHAVIVFGDIRGFTNFSRDRTPKEVAEMLNRFFEIVVACVEREGGMVNKFMGDGYLAFFGLYAKPDGAHPCDAAATAVLRIEEEARRLLKPHGLRPGAAANYGRVITGELGAEGRCEFTALGATVNLASRLEGFNASLGTSFLATKEFVDGLDEGWCEVRSTGSHEIKGYDQPVEIFEVSASALPVSTELARETANEL